MGNNPAIVREKWQVVADKYLSGLSMQKVADHFDVSIDAVTYVLRRLNVPRRTYMEANKLSFEAKKPSFTLRSIRKNAHDHDLVGAMLYWAEGYKRDSSSGIDFANSDADMVLAFWRFLNNRYALDPTRVYFSVYFYDDQNLRQLVTFWAKKLRVSPSKFKHSYKKVNSNPNARKLPHGVLHIKYNDKKLLRDVLFLIESFRRSFCVGGGAVNRT